MMKSRLYYAVICYILAFILLFVSVPIVKRLSYPKDTAVHTVKTLNKGEQITKKYIEEISIGAWNMPEEAFLTAEEVIGRYAAVDVVKGDILYQSKLSQLPMDGDVPKNILPEGNHVSLISLKIIEGSEYPMPETGDVINITK